MPQLNPLGGPDSSEDEGSNALWGFVVAGGRGGQGMQMKSTGDEWRLLFSFFGTWFFGC